MFTLLIAVLCVFQFVEAAVLVHFSLNFQEITLILFRRCKINGVQGRHPIDNGGLRLGRVVTNIAMPSSGVVESVLVEGVQIWLSVAAGEFVDVAEYLLVDIW